MKIIKKQGSKKPALYPSPSTYPLDICGKHHSRSCLPTICSRPNVIFLSTLQLIKYYKMVKRKWSERFALYPSPRTHFHVYVQKCIILYHVYPCLPTICNRPNVNFLPVLQLIKCYRMLRETGLERPQSI